MEQPNSYPLAQLELRVKLAMNLIFANLFFGLFILFYVILDGTFSSIEKLFSLSSLTPCETLIETFDENASCLAPRLDFQKNDRLHTNLPKAMCWLAEYNQIEDLSLYNPLLKKVFFCPKP